MIFIPVPFHGLMIVKQSSILFFFSLNVLSTNLLLRAPKPHIWIVCSSKSLNYSILTKKIKTAVWCDINPTVEKIRARERTGQGHMYEDESAQQHRRSRVSRQLKRSNQLQSSRSGRGKRSINITGGWFPPPLFFPRCLPFFLSLFGCWKMHVLWIHLQQWERDRRDESVSVWDLNRSH